MYYLCFWQTLQYFHTPVSSLSIWNINSNFSKKSAIWLGEKIGSTLLVPLDDAITDYYLVYLYFAEVAFCLNCAQMPVYEGLDLLFDAFYTFAR